MSGQEPTFDSLDGQPRFCDRVHGERHFLWLLAAAVFLHDHFLRKCSTRLASPFTSETTLLWHGIYLAALALVLFLAPGLVRLFVPFPVEFDWWNRVLAIPLFNLGILWGAICRNGRQQCLGFWIDCALGFRMRHLRRKTQLLLLTSNGAMTWQSGWLPKIRRPPAKHRRTCSRL